MIVTNTSMVIQMKIEKITDNKIKVTITPVDLQERNINIDTLAYNSPATQELFWEVMEQAQSELGFDTSDSQLCIEAVPDSKDGFIVTITKLEDDEDFEAVQKYVRGKLTKKNNRNKKKKGKNPSSLIIYALEDFDDLCNLSRQIQPFYTGESSLYKYNGTYYLLLLRNSLLLERPEALDSILTEFGTRVPNVPLFQGLLNEYGEMLIESNAVSVLGG